MTPRKIACLTDSCVDLSPEVLREKHIYTVPLRILCKDGEYLDGVTIDSAEVYRRLHAGELPKTSLPSTESMEQTLQRIAADGYDGIIAVMVSSGISGTYNLTRLAAEELEAENDGKIQMRVYDTLSGSIAQALILLQIMEDLENGYGWEELTQRRIPALIRNTSVAFSVDTLEYLLKGGRIGKITAAAGTLLQIKPILGFAPDGQLQSFAKVRGRNQVMGKLVDLMVKNCGTHKKYNLAVVNGGDPAGMELLREKLTAALPAYGFLCDGQINSTFSVYIGDNVLGVGIQLLD